MVIARAPYHAVIHNLLSIWVWQSTCSGMGRANAKSCTPSFFFFGQLLVHLYIGHLPEVKELHTGQQSGAQLTNSKLVSSVVLVPIATGGFSSHVP